MPDEAKSQEPPTWLIWLKRIVVVLISLAVLTLVLWAVYQVWLDLGRRPHEKYKDLGEAGQYGDSFGYVNSLFSGLAFAGVIIAVILQAIQLQLQHRELEETKTALEDSAKSQSRIARLDAMSILIKTYFDLEKSDERLINVYQENLVNKPDVSKQTVPFKLRTCLAILDGEYETLTAKEQATILKTLASERSFRWEHELLECIAECQMLKTTFLNWDMDTRIRLAHQSAELIIARLRKLEHKLLRLETHIECIYEKGRDPISTTLMIASRCIARAIRGCDAPSQKLDEIESGIEEATAALIEANSIFLFHPGRS